MHRDMEWRRMKKALFGASLIVAPALILVGQLIASGVYDGDDQGRYLASIADHETAHYAGNVISAAGTLLLAPVVIALGHLVRVRHLKYAVIAGGVGMLGALMFPGMWFAFTVVDHQAAQDPARAAMTGFFERLDDTAAIAPLAVGWVAMSLGLLLLAAGVLWASTVPRWMPALILAGAILLFVGESDAVMVAANALLLAGMGAIGATILRASLEAWEAGDLAHRPEAPRTSHLAGSPA